MPLLTAPDLSKSYGVTPILDHAQLHVGRGEKIGLVGRNGAGKSTLLRILAGVEAPDAGEITFRSGTHVAYLPQLPDLSGYATLLDVALAGTRKSRHPLEPYEQQVAAEQALKALGVPDPHLSVTLASGGTQRRAALAAALLQQPDLLLLDEPTNHLDADTAAWLESELKDFAGAVILVTHDRYFLNQVVGRIVELRTGTLYSYEGTLQDWLETRLEEEAASEKLEARRKNLLRVELDWLSRSPAARSTRPKARLQRAQALTQQVHEVVKPLQLPFPPAERLGRTVLEAKDLQVGFQPVPAGAGRTVVRHLDLILQRGDRLGLVGPNGAGKTTLLRTFLGELPALGGQVVVGKNTHLVSIDQHRSGLDPSETVAQAAVPSGGEWVRIGEQKLHVASYLEMFLFRSQDLRQPVGTLSGGQRFRLLLARRLQEPMNVLVLDEPTNDLDFETLEVLEEALLQYPGCLLTVSHDRAFLDRVCTGILHVVGDGTVERHAGNYSQFLHNREERRRLAAKAEPAKVQVQARKAEAPPKLTFAEEKRLAGIEAEIEAAEARVAGLEQRLADPAVAADYGQLQTVTREHLAAVEARDAVYAEWQRLEDKQAAWLAWKAGG